MNRLFGNPDRVVSMVVKPVEDVARLEIGHYWRIISINRVSGEVKLNQATASYLKPTWWERLRGLKPIRVIFVGEGA